jgi:hypothetical protein
MCNCGNKRSQYNKTNPASHPMASNASASSGNPKIKFMYTGHSSLKIIGNTSGRPYHFRYRGEVLEINAGDSSFMMTIPELSMVKAG